MGWLFGRRSQEKHWHRRSCDTVEICPHRKIWPTVPCGAHPRTWRRCFTAIRFWSATSCWLLQLLRTKWVFYRVYSPFPGHKTPYISAGRPLELPERSEETVHWPARGRDQSHRGRFSVLCAWEEGGVDHAHGLLRSVIAAVFDLSKLWLYVKGINYYAISLVMEVLGEIYGCVRCEHEFFSK